MLAALPVDCESELCAVAVAASGLVAVPVASGLDFVLVVLVPPEGGARGACDMPVEMQTMERTTSLDDSSLGELLSKARATASVPSALEKGVQVTVSSDTPDASVR